MTDNVNVEPAKRGRKAGQRGQSKDFAAFMALRAVNFAEFAQRADIGSRDWDDDIAMAIIEALRYGDNPVF